MESPRKHRVRELARVLPVTTRTIRRWIKRGLLDASKIGGEWLIPHDEFIRLGGEDEARLTDDESGG